MNYPFLPADPNFGRKIPPPLNPDAPSMIQKLTHAYDEIHSEILEFEQQITHLARGGELDVGECTGLWLHYRQLSDAVNGARRAARTWDGKQSDGGEQTQQVHFIADHAKYVYAVATRDIAKLQYKIGDLAYIGKLGRQPCHDLQWLHCVPMWEKVYSGTLCVVRDETDWDCCWDWGGNTYHDGRQVMIQARVKDWETLERLWPSNELISGDGAINEHPRGSVCQIAPVIDPRRGDYLDYAPIEIDLDELIAQRDRVMKPPSAPLRAVPPADQSTCRRPIRSTV